MSIKIINRVADRALIVYRASKMGRNKKPYNNYFSNVKE